MRSGTVILAATLVACNPNGDDGFANQVTAYPGSSGVIPNDDDASSSRQEQQQQSSRQTAANAAISSKSSSSSSSSKCGHG